MHRTSGRLTMRRAAGLTIAPAALFATVGSGFAMSPAAAARWHAQADGAVATIATALAGVRLFADPGSVAQREADALLRSRPDDAALMARIAAQPVATWIGGWVRDVEGDVGRLAAAAAGRGAIPVLVAYNIPNRDCGSHSAGGERDADGDGRWIRRIAAGLKGRDAVVVLEPDALSHLTCLDREGQDTRLAMLRDAVSVLKRGGARVYVDAGNARWTSAEEMASRLRRGAIDVADGFALNVSNFVPTPESIRYGERLSGLVGGRHFVIDTSRNGLGGNGDWCNPRGRALGALPTTRTGNELVDALLWVKQPGESDGTCNGGPKAGRWWPAYALELARNQPAELALASR